MTYQTIKGSQWRGCIYCGLQYKTDDSDLGIGKGPEHWVRVKTPKKKGGYEPPEETFNPIDITVEGLQDLTPQEIASRRPKDGKTICSSDGQPNIDTTGTIDSLRQPDGLVI